MRRCCWPRIGSPGPMLRRVQQIQAQRSKAGQPVVEVRVDPVNLGDV